MQIKGLNKTTLLDYPGQVAATIFLGGCNFRCPFCHNGVLVLNPASQPSISEGELLDFLIKRRPILSGVCISGGEPTLQSDLPILLASIKKLGYLVKLDTNGSNPEMLTYLYQNSFLDYVAMDIKSRPQDYPMVTGIPENPALMRNILQSAQYLMSCGVEYEFRTTVVKELHPADSFPGIADWISGCKNYYLQSFRDGDGVMKKGFHSCSREELDSFVSILRPRIPSVCLRGVD